MLILSCLVAKDFNSATSQAVCAKVCTIPSPDASDLRFHSRTQSSTLGWFVLRKIMRSIPSYRQSTAFKGVRPFFCRGEDLAKELHFSKVHSRCLQNRGAIPRFT